MKIHFSAFADEAAPDLGGQINALKQNGVGLIDVRAIDGVNIAAMPLEKCREYAQRFAGEGIGVNCIASPVGKVPLSAPFSQTEESFCRLLEKAHIFETDKMRIFSFYESRGQKEEVVARLGRLAELAAAENVVLYHENEAGIFGERADDVAALLREVPALRNLFDWANYILVGENIGHAIALLLEKSEFFHMKDATVQGSIVPAGEGHGKIKESLLGLHGRAEIFVTAEPHLMEFEGYRSIDARTIHSERRFDSGRDAFDAGIGACKKVLSALG